jgi:hypothetical protein
MFANLASLELINDADLRRVLRNVSLPLPIGAEHILDAGYAPVEYDPMPALASEESVQPGPLRREGDRVLQAWTVVTPDAAALKELRLRAIAARRYLAETAGISLQGMPIDTGRDSQGLIVGAAVQAMLTPEYSVRWKTVDGFVTLSAEQVLGVAQAVRAHVQACFDREADLMEEVDNGTYEPTMLEIGWPQ